MDPMPETIDHTVRTIAIDEDPSETVVAAVADAKGVDPLDLDPLYDAIDPDALDSIFGSPIGGGTSTTELRFPMAGCEVVVRGDGEVVVGPSVSRIEGAGRVASRE